MSNPRSEDEPEEVHLDLTLPEAVVLEDAVEILEDVLGDAHLDTSTLEDAHEKLDAAIEEHREAEA
jgi:hypothetical protein